MPGRLDPFSGHGQRVSLQHFGMTHLWRGMNLLTVKVAPATREPPLARLPERRRWAEMRNSRSLLRVQRTIPACKRNAPGKGGDVGTESLAGFWLLPGALGLDLVLPPPIRAVSGEPEAEHSAMRAGEGGGRLLRAGGQAQERSKNNLRNSCFTKGVSRIFERFLSARAGSATTGRRRRSERGVCRRGTRRATGDARAERR